MAASKSYTFINDHQVLNTFGQDCKNENIKNETMFFNSDFDFAMKNGGPITRAFLNSLPLDWKEKPLVFDSRVHLLMPGWYPCIPGWHHDDVGRTSTGNRQPDYDNLQYKSEHILGLVNADICPTYFLNGKTTMPAVPENETIYKIWDKEIEKLIKEESIEVVTCKDRTLYYFDWQTFHTGTKALQNGWRWFGRVSRNTERLKNVTNEIRINTQVYLENPKEGW